MIDRLPNENFSQPNDTDQVMMNMKVRKYIGISNNT